MEMSAGLDSNASESFERMMFILSSPDSIRVIVDAETSTNLIRGVSPIRSESTVTKVRDRVDPIIQWQLFAASPTNLKAMDVDVVNVKLCSPCCGTT
jgi:hypothetical protein